MDGKPKRRKGKPGLVKPAPKGEPVTFIVGSVRVSVFRETLGKLRIISSDRLEFVETKDLTPPPPTH